MRDERTRRGSSSELERRADRDHRRAAGVDGVDDLSVVDALEVDGGAADLAVAELALDDDQRHALVGVLDRVRMTELMWANRGARRRPPRSAAGGCARRRLTTARPRVGPEMTPNRGPTGSSRRMTPHGSSCSQSPLVHPHLAAATALAAAHEQRAASVQIGLAEREGLVDAQPRAPEDDDQAA